MTNSGLVTGGAASDATKSFRIGLWSDRENIAMGYPGMNTQMSPGYPDVTEQDPSLPCEILISEESESQAEFVLEVWAQHRRLGTTWHFIKKKWTDSLELVE